jgi:hypothetical protein
MHICACPLMPRSPAWPAHLRPPTQPMGAWPPLPMDRPRPPGTLWCAGTSGAGAGRLLLAPRSCTCSQQAPAVACSQQLEHCRGGSCLPAAGQHPHPAVCSAPRAPGRPPGRRAPRWTGPCCFWRMPGLPGRAAAPGTKRGDSCAGSCPLPPCSPLGFSALGPSGARPPAPGPPAAPGKSPPPITSRRRGGLALKLRLWREPRRGRRGPALGVGLMYGRLFEDVDVPARGASPLN